MVELDKYVIGQAKAKRAVAIALRNRTRRQRLPAEMAEEVTPKNILMIGPTGCGKTEISRRLAKLADAPFVKVEATKFTEVGYVGREVDSIIKDLMDVAVKMTREERRLAVRFDMCTATTRAEWETLESYRTGAVTADRKLLEQLGRHHRTQAFWDRVERDAG